MMAKGNTRHVGEGQQSNISGTNSIEAQVEPTSRRGRAGVALTVSTGRDVASPGASERSLTTPKKKWMQLWSAQHAQDNEARIPAAVEEPRAGNAEASSESTTMYLTSTEPHPEPQVEQVEQVGGQSKVDAGMPDVAEDGEVLSDSETNVAVHTIQHSGGSLQPTALRVTMPTNAGSSTLSPSGDHASPTATSTSISPSSKTKDSEGSQAQNASPLRVLAKGASASQLLESTSSTESVIANTVSGAQESAIHKRKLLDASLSASDDPIELTESERQRLERRRAKKSKWDEGDPRKHGGSLDLAALNLLSSTNTPASHPASFAKFPRHRPTFRQSYSLDAKEPTFNHRSNFRATVHAALQSLSPTGATPSNQEPRRPLNHSASLPIDRPRPPFRPSSRYLPPQ